MGYLGWTVRVQAMEHFFSPLNQVFAKPPDPPSAVVGIHCAGCTLTANAAIMLPHMADSISCWGTPSLLLIHTE